MAGVRPEEVTARVVLHLERYAGYLTATYGHDRLPGGASAEVSGWRDLSRSKIGFSSAEVSAAGYRERRPSASGWARR
jgi:hypothetical protein